MSKYSTWLLLASLIVPSSLLASNPHVASNPALVENTNIQGEMQVLGQSAGWHDVRLKLTSTANHGIDLADAEISFIVRGEMANIWGNLAPMSMAAFNVQHEMLDDHAQQVRVTLQFRDTAWSNSVLSAGDSVHLKFSALLQDTEDTTVKVFTQHGQPIDASYAAADV